MVVEPDGYAHAGNPLEMSDSQLAAYADYTITYSETGAHNLVKEQRVKGAGGQASDGNTSGLYSYTFTPRNQWDFNLPNQVLTETQPSGTRHEFYTNFAGQTLYDITTADGKQWTCVNKYDARGSNILSADPSAVQSVARDNDGLVTSVTLYPHAGHITVYKYGESTTAPDFGGTGDGGDVKGYLKQVSIQQGVDGKPIPQESYLYKSHYATWGNVVAGTTYHISEERAYIDEADPSKFAKTDYLLSDWERHYPGYSSSLPGTIVTLLPEISSTQNGSGLRGQTTAIYDDFGRIVSFIDANGRVTKTEYDPATGAVTKMIVDYGGKNLTTTTVVDDFGRPKEVKDPAGHVTGYLYDDSATYSKVNVIPPIGPETVVRHDLRYGYIDTYTTSGGVLLSLTRQILDNAGRVVAEDRFLTFGGKTYSQLCASQDNLTSITKSIHTDAEQETGKACYYRTTYEYNTAGLMYKSTDAMNGVTEQEYDSLGRPTKSKIGGVVVKSVIYDNGGVGDSNVTAVELYPNGEGKADTRRTAFHYDWRNRLIAQFAGDGSLDSVDTYYAYDNLDRQTSVEVYDGHDIFMDELLAQTDTYYDDLGQVYKTIQSGYDETTNSFQDDRDGDGNLLGGLTTQYWYDPA
ncbi:MAG: hypothetical protein EHM48_08050, partial [Planctomycetaceae bacterium]